MTDISSVPLQTTPPAFQAPRPTSPPPETEDPTAVSTSPASEPNRTVQAPTSADLQTEGAELNTSDQTARTPPTSAPAPNPTIASLPTQNDESNLNTSNSRLAEAFETRPPLPKGTIISVDA